MGKRALGIPSIGRVAQENTKKLLNMVNNIAIKQP